MGNRLSAWLIGENSLVTECALVLRQNGYLVLGIVSPEEGVRRLAAGQGFRTAGLGPDLPDVLRAEPFDYLFSVVNMRMLPASVLGLPRLLSVNFHDALLPAGAGVHAAAWAVAGGADRHGVTWHVMTEEADAGDILVQREFGLDDSATSQSVNLECWRAGLDSFRELAGMLASGQQRRAPQDLARRTYHGLADRPDGGFVLSWRDLTARICALVRAGDFGPYPNAFGVPKILLPDGSCLLVREAVAVPGTGRHERGLIVAAGEAEVTVAAADGLVRLTGLAALDGTSLATSDVLPRCGIRAGTVLPEPAGALAGVERAAVRAERHWVRRLAGLRPLRLPFTAELGAGPRWRSHPVAVPAWIGASADPAVSVAAAALAYLGRLTGESGFDVGLRVPRGRDGEQLLAEVVPLRSPDDGLEFDRFAGQVAERIADASARGPFLLDVPARYPELAGRPLVPPVVFDVTAVSGVAADRVPGAVIGVRVSPGGGCVLVIDESTVPPPTALSLAGGFAAFLDRLPADGLASAPLVSPAEERWQAITCNATGAGYPDARVPDLVAGQVAACPGRVAVSCGGEQMTYRELGERSARLAAYLASRGAGPGTRVGVYLERSADLLVTLLAVLRAGAAYVPLDPVYPAARISYMLQDADVAVLVTQASLARNVTGAAAAVTVIDQCRDELLRMPAATAAAPAGEDDLAYVIYTSGTTGRPKGVQVTHRGLTNFLCSMAREPGFAPGSTLLAVTTVCFDIAALELFLPLITGGTVEIAPAGAVGDGDALRQLLGRIRPAVLQATPVTWKMLIAAGWDGDRGLTALCGGEALPRDLADDLLARAGSVWNLYGPTETTIWSTAWRVRPAEKVSIGTAVANTTCHILDSSMRTVPEGFPGELYIGGDGLAAGYRNRPELTAERFVPCPAGLGTGLLYRTGDLARRGHDGRLYYLSRVDNQVKLHGHRIEPGEIEAVLRDHPAVEDAVTVVRGDRLAAYLIPAGAAPGPDELRGFLRSRLPAYMVPAMFTVMDEFPQTPNGKVDRKALPDPAAGDPATGDPAAGDLTYRTEQDVLAAIRAHAAALLGQPASRIGPGDRFADLGIDSVAAVDLARRLTSLTGQPLTAIAVFEHPTPAALAARLWQRLSGPEAAGSDAGPDLVADAVLPASIAAATAVPDPRHVVLTGATGFVGAFLLRELVTATTATVHCIVRAADNATAAKRLQRTLEEYGIWTGQAASRIRAWAGDLSRPLLGLSAAEFDELAILADAIYHAGAHVNAILPYTELKSANVGGTREALALAARGRPSAFHHVSTIEVLAGPADGPVGEDHPAGPAAALRGGYARSKWVAEQFVTQAAQRGIPAAIYRLPRILGDTQTGACQTRDLLWQVLKGCIQAHAVPADPTVTFQFAPADWTATALVALSRTARTPGAAYHLAAPARISLDAIAGYLQAAGYELRQEPLDQWAATIRAQPGNAAAAALDVFLAELTGHGWSRLQLGTTATTRALGDHAPPCPDLTPALFATYLRYFTQTGYLPPPRGVTG